MWIEVVFVITLGILALLWSRMRSERIERLRWRGFKADEPMDVTGLEPFDPNRYSTAGRKLYPYFVVFAVLSMVLFVVVFVRLVN